MIMLFTGIVCGILLGVGGSALLVAVREMWADTEPVFDLSDLMADIQPDGTPFLSEIEKHRQAHMRAMKPEPVEHPVDTIRRAIWDAQAAARGE